MTFTLRKKTLVIVTLTLVALIIILYFVSRSIVLASFSDTEKDDVGRHVTRVNQALSNELDRMYSTLTDWARPGQPISLERLSNLLDEQGAAVTPQGRSGTVDLLANLDLNVFFFTVSTPTNI